MLAYEWYMMSSDLSLVHLIVGAGSPTEPQGRRTSFIQGVVTVPPKDRILAGTAHTHRIEGLDRILYIVLYSDTHMMIDTPRKQRKMMPLFILWDA